jgi:SAM domain (Sterile alpha motif)
MDLGGWLRSLGLGKYEAAFRENEIDETVLPSLTHETLKELGVTAIGHRLKLLSAIDALRNDAKVQPPTVTAEPARPSAGRPTAAPVAEAVGERRHLTVMFCDLVGSTSISAALDAEDWRDLWRVLINRPTSFRFRRKPGHSAGVVESQSLTHSRHHRGFSLRCPVAVISKEESWN